MRRIAFALLLFLVACGGGSDDNPTGPGEEPEAPRPLEFTYLNRLPQPDGLSGISEAGGRAIAVGRGGAVVIREPGETTWRRVQAPTRSTFTSVHMIDPLTALATAIDGTWLTRDGGVNWRLADATTSMREIAFRNGLAIVGGRSGILFSTDLENWEPANDSPPDIIDVGFAGDNVIWAMSAFEMFRSTDGAKNWVKFIEGSSFRAFAYAEESFGALGRGTEVQGTTNGTTFTKVHDLFDTVVDIDFRTPALGVMLTREGRVYTSDSRGKAWSFQVQLDAGILPADIELTTSGEVLVVGSKGLIGESSGGVTSISEISSGFFADLEHVAFGNAFEGFACSQRGGDPLFRTTDAGRSWEEIVAPVTNPRDLEFHSDEFVLILSSDGSVLKSDDLGETWTDTGAGSESFMTCLSISDRDTWLTGGNRFIARTADGGTRWTLEPVEILVRAIDRFPGTDVYLGVGQGVIRSEDGGVTWSAPVPAIVSGNDVVCIDETTAVVVGPSIYRTTDQGLTWELIRDAGFDVLYAVAFLDALHGLAVGDDGLMFETLDGGQSWDAVQVTGQPLLDITLRGPGGSSVVMVGESGVVIDGSDPEE